VLPSPKSHTRTSGTPVELLTVDLSRNLTGRPVTIIRGVWLNLAVIKAFEAALLEIGDTF
jgi:hypothetical protein